ncbi:MAG TPA: fumarylacetoacetate hydrolase family protein [Symbiobacteriaceae bacterium]|jgi:2-keto-4-pentenoate hydratase/2-oxohepta-3-ene-1,7-dioic acid hydratase in catechol pathway
MQYIRFFGSDGPRWAGLEGATAHELDGAPYLGGKATGRTLPLESVKLLPPVEPSKLVCIGRNYADHAAELGNQAPTEPMFFLKPPSALTAPGAAIVIARPEHAIHWEAELAVVIGKQAKAVSEADALSYVFGYTIANDVSDRDYQKADQPFGFGRGKCFDTYCPCGPVLVTEGINPLDVHLTLTCNGDVRQSDSTSLMLHRVPKLIAYISEIMTLVPGDVLLTGTPKGVGPMKAGDIVEITIPGIGTLSNPVR